MRPGKDPSWFDIEADDRERGSGVGEAFCRETGVRLAWKRLAVGDYRVDGRLLVERKTVLDFAVSVVDGRLFSQCARLAGSGLCPILVLEGSGAMLVGRGFSREALQGAMLTVQLTYGIPVLRTVSPDETAHTLVLAARQVARTEGGLVRRPGYRPRSRRGRQSFVLQGLPGTGPVLARRLLERFGSVEGVMTASVGDLGTVRGIGRTRAQAIREAVREPGVPYGQSKVLTYHDTEI